MTRTQVELPPELERRAKSVAKSAGVTLQALIETAIAEKLAAAKAMQPVSRANSKSSRDRALALLARASDVPPVKGDELPEELAAKLEKRWFQSRSRSLRRN